MNYEEKYKETLERAIIAHKDEDRHLKATLERIFPELKKSEDDKIREKLIRLVKKYWEGDEYRLIEDVKQYESMLAWLKKQDEQKNKITFEDVLALECAMKTVRITEGGNELYEMLVSLYNKIHNVYLNEKQGKQKVEE